jgi:exonuclease SbcD
MSGVTTGIRILHTADLHLREEDDEAWHSLLAILDTAGGEKADLLLICGDLFEGEVEAERLRPAVRKLFSGNPFDIVLLPGNHDHSSYGEGRYYGDDVALVENFEEPVLRRGLYVWGIPFEPIGGDTVLHRIRRIGDLCDAGGSNILLFHGEVMDSFFTAGDYGGEGIGRYMPVRLGYFKDSPIEYVLGGHFHTRFDIRRFGKGGYFVYPGSPCAHSIKETGPRKVDLFTYGEPPAEFVLPVPFYESIDVFLNPLDPTHPLEAVKEKIGKADERATLILRVDGFFNGNLFGMTEADLARGIRDLLGSASENHLRLSFRDFRNVLEDELFRKFTARLEDAGFDDRTRDEVYRTALEAMMQVDAAGRT